MPGSSSIRAISASVAVLFLLVGCKDSTTPNPKCGISGTSDANVTGAVTASVDGCAMYVVFPGENATGITLAGGNLTTQTHKIVFSRPGTRPATGTYTVGLPGGTAISGSFILDGGSAEDRVFSLTAGTIEITTSSAGTLRGTFNSVTAKEGPGSTAPTVTITGNFSAKCVDAPETDC
jgi:hypothetical protein